MTDVEKLLALVTIQQATMNKHQRHAANEAWLAFLATTEATEKAAYKPPVFLGYGADDGDDPPPPSEA